MGIVSEEATRARVDAAAQALGMDDYEMCMFHPQAKLEKYRLSILDCRKPSPYMLEQLMERLGATPEETTMVGDRIEDMTAASLAGVRFAWSVDFF
jgi:D-glycero-D-manno-heptose 1,7-bisphosphate phosphatase